MNAKYGNSPTAIGNYIYDRDFYTWAMETARAIRERRFEGIEWDAVAEELEDMGKSEKRALESQLERLHAHLLKWRLQSEKRHQDAARERSWRATIRDARMRIEKILKENPGLRPGLPELFSEVYPGGVNWAIAETGLPESLFPSESPWTLDDALDDSFWPE